MVVTQVKVVSFFFFVPILSFNKSDQRMPLISVLNGMGGVQTKIQETAASSISP